MKDLNLSSSTAFYLEKGAKAVGVGVGYSCDELDKKQVAELIAWLVKALARMK